MFGGPGQRKDPKNRDENGKNRHIGKKYICGTIWYITPRYAYDVKGAALLCHQIGQKRYHSKRNFILYKMLKTVFRYLYLFSSYSNF